MNEGGGGSGSSRGGDPWNLRVDREEVDVGLLQQFTQQQQHDRAIRSSPSTQLHSVALRKVLKDPVTQWKLLSIMNRNNKEFILTVLERAETLPPKSDFERFFPQTLRFDPDVVLAFAARSDFVTLYRERHLYVPGCLTGNKQVMMAYCSKIPRSLQDCSEELTDDPDVVLAAVAMDGLELQYASRRLQEDETMLRAACARDGRALDFCPPGPVRDKIVQDRDFLMTVLRNNGGSMLRLVQNPLKSDRELLLTAVQHGMLLRMCPDFCHNDVDFVVAAVTRNPSAYLGLDPNWRENVVVAEAAITAPDSDPEVIDKALKAVPILLRQDAVAAAITDRADIAYMQEYLVERPPLLQNKAIMLRAIGRYAALYPYCLGGLKEDYDIVMVALTEEYILPVMRALSASWLRRHEDAVVKALTVCHRGDLRMLRRIVPGELWRTCREVQMAWIRRGCHVLEEFASAVRTDREMALHVADFSWEEFHKVGDKLRGDQDFMKEAVTRSGKVLRYASPHIRDDIVMAVRAVANDARALAPSIRISRAFLQQHVHDLLRLHDVFVQEFLRGITLDGSTNSNCALPSLDRGVETGTAFKQLIAVFLGVPTGELLTAYRQCLDHLVNPPPLVTTTTTTVEQQAQHGVGQPIDGHQRIRRRLRGPPHWDADDMMEDRIPLAFPAGRSRANIVAAAANLVPPRLAVAVPGGAPNNNGAAAVNNAERRRGLLERVFEFHGEAPLRREEEILELHARRRALMRLRFRNQVDNEMAAVMVDEDDFEMSDDDDAVEDLLV